ncbi:hypothetical protein K7X08_016909 [Anisodus acutangulus]|uniref:N-acetyltransferase domain-containing protein n=1 Tax=Anisodus acutangulus TaxID=402998 RepID=A0A9Q1R5V2_9SOLA|nr:hypothetical protein K7X08_016909 [Anisodus acutangulus]
MLDLLKTTFGFVSLQVIPSLRRRGIGRKIVQRILRILVNRDIYDIAALCSDQEKPFFRACGFGDDVLASTTMMSTREFRSSLEEQFSMLVSTSESVLQDLALHVDVYCWRACFSQRNVPDWTVENNSCKPQRFVVSLNHNFRGSVETQFIHKHRR